MPLSGTDIGLGMVGEKDEETQAQNKIPLVPLSLACSFAKVLNNLGLSPRRLPLPISVAETGDRDGRRMSLPSKCPFPPRSPSRSLMLDLSLPAGRQTYTDATETQMGSTWNVTGVFCLFPTKLGVSRGTWVYVHVFNRTRVFVWRTGLSFW